MRSLLLVALPFLSSPERTLAFRPDGRATTCRRYVEGVSVSAIASASVTTSHGDDASAAVKSRSGPSPSGECYYRRVDGPWRPRKELRDLKIVSLHAMSLTEERTQRRASPADLTNHLKGERLFASRIPSSDLLNGKTGELERRRMLRVRSHADFSDWITNNTLDAMRVTWWVQRPEGFLRMRCRPQGP